MVKDYLRKGGSVLNKASQSSIGIDNILKTHPSWIMKWGVTLVSFLLLILTLACYYIEFPEVISARVTITDVNRPVFVVANRDGIIDRVLVKDNDLINENDYLYILRGAANYEDIVRLQSVIKILDRSNNLASTVKITSLDKDLHVGDMQGAYHRLLHALEEFKEARPSSTYSAEIADINAISHGYSLLNLYNTQNSSKKIINYDDSIIPDNLDVSENNINSLTKNINETNISQINYQIKKIELSKSIREITTKEKERLEELEHGVKEALLAIKIAFYNWEERYVVKAPKHGIIRFHDLPKQKQFVRTGEDILVITNRDRYLEAYAYAPILNSGKIKAGQKAVINLDAYPAQEYGSIFSSVNSISVMPHDSTYIVKLQVPQSLKTDQNIILQPSYIMSGNVDIIISKRSLFSKILEG